jgi:hypothetical protein
MAEHHNKRNIRHYSRKPKPAGTLAGQLRLLKEFANLRDEDAEKFRSKHPDFLVLATLTSEGWLEGVVHRLGGGGPNLIQHRALMLAETIAKLQPIPALRKRDILRAIWRADQYSNDYLKILLTGSRVEFDWKRGELVYSPENDFEYAIYALFRNSSRAKFCANPDCPAPYFIGARKSERYCSEDCAAVYQRKWKRNWWKQVGSSRRKEQRARKRKDAKRG